ncbi:MAG: nuclear transport factor 2 family protein [Bacteroidetes bacterium]|nr:nuclear transport factor 2 family protein [Bacteroidota bacterium]MDA1119521.1 nuclear transport factor 2 family protein [Bacteroidota bacterium]
MEKVICLIVLVTVINSGCQQKPASELIDINGAKKAVNDLLDNYHNSMQSKDSSNMMMLLSDDGLYCGTDPMELWDKKTLSNYMTKAFADTSLVINYNIDKREIRVAKDGETAVTIEQFIMDVISPKIPIRAITYAMKDGDVWKIDFLSLSLIPTNADTPKINKAVE